MTTFVTRETICSAVKLNVLLGGGGGGGGGGDACLRMEAYETCFWTQVGYFGFLVSLFGQFLCE